MLVVAPDPTDWIVSLRPADGSPARRYRVSPGSLTDAAAIARALRVARLAPEAVADVDICRAAEHSRLTVYTTTAEFDRLVASARRRGTIGRC